MRLLEGGYAEMINAFGIKTGSGQLSINESGFRFYHYWTDADSYQDSTNTSTVVATAAAWEDLLHHRLRARDDDGVRQR